MPNMTPRRKCQEAWNRSSGKLTEFYVKKKKKSGWIWTLRRWQFWIMGSKLKWETSGREHRIKLFFKERWVRVVELDSVLEAREMTWPEGKEWGVCVCVQLVTFCLQYSWVKPWIYRWFCLVHPTPAHLHQYTRVSREVKCSRMMKEWIPRALQNGSSKNACLSLYVKL